MPHENFVVTTWLPYSMRDSHGIQLGAMLSVTVEEPRRMPATGFDPLPALLAALALMLGGAAVMRRRAPATSRR